MNILSTGLGKVLPEFIESRFKLYAELNVQLYLLHSEGEIKSQKLKNVRYIYLHSFRKSNLWRSLIFLIRSIPGILSSFTVFRKLIQVAPQKNPFLKCLWAIERIQIRKVKPDLIHVQWLGSVSALYWLKEIFNVPLVASVRGSQVTIYPWLNATYLEQIKDCITRADFIHCVSADLKNSLSQFDIPLNMTKVFVNYNGVDLDRFKPLASITESTKIRLLSVGTFMWRKNFLIQAFLMKELLKLGYVNIVMDWVGGGQYLEDLQKVVLSLDLNDYIHVHGYVDQNALPGYYNSADIYLSTSLAEGLSNSVLEAAACGLPCIAFNCEGMTEAIQDGETGYILSTQTLSELTEKVRLLLDDPDKRKAMSKQAIKYVIDNYDSKVHAQYMVANYSKILNAKL